MSIFDKTNNTDGTETLSLKQVEGSKIDGKQYHSPDLTEQVKEFKRQGKNSEAEKLLYKMIDATEAESGQLGLGVAPWAYNQLAIVLRKQKKAEEELALLQRFSRQKHSLGSSTEKLLERLRKIEGGKYHD